MDNEKFSPGQMEIEKVGEVKISTDGFCFLVNANFWATAEEAENLRYKCIAAPDMYEALQAILNSNTKAQKEYSLGLAKAALSKANPQNK